MGPKTLIVSPKGINQLTTPVVIHEGCRGAYPVLLGCIYTHPWTDFSRSITPHRRGRHCRKMHLRKAPDEIFTVPPFSALVLFPALGIPVLDVSFRPQNTADVTVGSITTPHQRKTALGKVLLFFGAVFILCIFFS